MPPVLIVSAHPDDETIGAAGLLLARRRAIVVQVTDGAPRDAALRAPGVAPTREAYATLRREEALAALAEAGLGPADVLLLGLVDQEVCAELTRLARELVRMLRLLPGPTPERARTLGPVRRAAKRRMLGAYASQRAVLAPFEGLAEGYRRAPPLPPGRRPHPGALWYEAMGWARFEQVDAAAREAAAALRVGDAAWR